MNPKPDDNDADLFREAVRDVKPLAYDAPVGSQPDVRVRVARFTRADRHAVLQESLYADVGDPEVASGEELVFAREGIQKPSCASSAVVSTGSKRKSTCMVSPSPKPRKPCGRSWRRRSSVTSGA